MRSTLWKSFEGARLLVHLVSPPGFRLSGGSCLQSHLTPYVMRCKRKMRGGTKINCVKGRRHCKLMLSAFTAHQGRMFLQGSAPKSKIRRGLRPDAA